MSDLRDIPTAWMRGVKSPSSLHGPAEWDAEFVYGDDPPEGDGWIPLYRKHERLLDCTGVKEMRFNHLFIESVAESRSHCARCGILEADYRDEKPWTRCPSTHCERRGECASPNDCIIKGKSEALRQSARQP